MPVEKKKKLVERMQRFVDSYLIDPNATQAAKDAGYSTKTADVMGCRLLKRADVKAAIEAAKVAREKRTQIDQDYVLYTIQDTIERCRQAVPVLDNEGNPTGEFKFEPGAVLKGCELLGKNLSLWKEKVEVTGKDGGPIEHKNILSMTDEELLAIARQAVKTS